MVRCEHGYLFGRNFDVTWCDVMCRDGAVMVRCELTFIFTGVTLPTPSSHSTVFPSRSLLLLLPPLLHSLIWPPSSPHFHPHATPSYQSAASHSVSHTSHFRFWSDSLSLLSIPLSACPPHVLPSPALSFPAFFRFATYPAPSSPPLTCLPSSPRTCSCHSWFSNPQSPFTVCYPPPSSPLFLLISSLFFLLSLAHIFVAASNSLRLPFPS